MDSAHITKDTPIAMLTVGQLQEILQSSTPPKVFEKPSQSEPQTPKEYLYGLRGIRVQFEVCHTTAQRYKDTFLKSAIIQNGKKIIVDKKLAIELFAKHNESLAE